MANSTPTLDFITEPPAIFCKGKWTTTQLDGISEKINALDFTSESSITIDGSQMEDLDTAGALLIHHLVKKLKQKNSVTFHHFNNEQKTLLELVEKQLKSAKKIPPKKALNFFARYGMSAITNGQQILAFFNFMGEIFIKLFSWMTHTKRILWKNLLYIIESTGYKALPIIGLLSFLIGMVLAYQMGLQLRNYGASIFIVNLLGLSIMREFAPLITAIILAGRSGASFTAQIGTMKVNSEIDALLTMGISPIDQLVLPKIIGLCISLPLLSVWSSCTAIAGGMLMAHNMLDISYITFLNHFKEAITLKQFIIGLIKAPVFAFIIACVGCFQGLRVERNADSVGRQTTKSVVQAIFLVITTDALFSIILSWYNL